MPLLTYLWNRFLAFGERRYIEIFADVPAIPEGLKAAARSETLGRGDRPDGQRLSHTHEHSRPRTGRGAI
jgi:hypothetical protein